MSLKVRLYIVWSSQSYSVFASVFYSDFLLFLQLQITLTTIFQRMEPIKPQEQLINIHQRTYLQPVNFNIPLHFAFTKKIVSSTLLQQREHMMATERINRSQGDKKLSDIKQILSKSLFSKDKKKALIQKQKFRDFLCGTKLDNLPISPQTEQKESIKLLNFLRIKNNDNFAKKRNKKQAKPHESCKQARACQYLQEYDTLGQYSQGGFLHCNDQIQKDPVDISSLLDEKFNNILEMNFAQQGDMSLDIESKFAVRMPKKDKQQIQLLEPSPPEDRIAIHQKLLQEENIYLRDQLIVFTSIIQTQRELSQEYKAQMKNLKKDNSKLRTKNTLIQKELLQREQNIYDLSHKNSQYLRQYQQLSQEKDLLQSKFQTLLRQYELILSKLQEFQQQKEKEIQQIVEERNKEKQILLQQIREKDKDILQLTELVQDLKTRISGNQDDKEVAERKKDNFSMQIDKVIEQDCMSEDEGELQMTSSICLSLAEAESLKNIIQEKQQMFQQGIESLKKINSENEEKYTKTIEQLQNKLVCMQTTKVQQIQNLKKHYIKQIEQLKAINYQNNVAMSRQIIEQQERKGLLMSQIKMLQEKLEQNLKDQDQQLEQLLQNCVNQLEKERHVNNILREQFTEQRKANYLMRQEIEKLKRLFTKELYLIQQIQGGSYIN